MASAAASLPAPAPGATAGVRPGPTGRRAGLPGSGGLGGIGPPDVIGGGPPGAPGRGGIRRTSRPQLVIHVRPERQMTHENTRNARRGADPPGEKAIQGRVNVVAATGASGDDHDANDVPCSYPPSLSATDGCQRGVDCAGVRLLSYTLPQSVDGVILGHRVRPT